MCSIFQGKEQMVGYKVIICMFLNQQWILNVFFFQCAYILIVIILYCKQS